MSGQQEQWGELGLPDQQDPRDATLDLSRLIGILRPDASAEGNGNGIQGNGVTGRDAQVKSLPDPDHSLPDHSAPGDDRAPVPPLEPGARSSRPARHAASPPAQSPAPDSGRPHLPPEVTRPYGTAGGGDARPGPAEWPATAPPTATLTASPPATAPLTANPPATDSPVTAPPTVAPPTAAPPASLPPAGQDEAPAGHAASKDTAAPAESPAREPVPPRTPPHGPADSADQPAEPVPPGSIADLRRRLERLPFGHPSSPYHVDGERKPPPPRLKHLELAPPGRERSGAAANRPYAADASQGALLPPPAELGAADDAEETAAEVSAAVPEPDGGPGWQTAAVAGEPDSPDQADGASPVSPHTALDGTWTWGRATLTRDQVRIAEDAHERFRDAEGRDLFGGYGSEGLTATLRRVEERLEHGWLAPDTEQRALLDPDTFKARFAEMIRRHPDRTVEHLAYRVPGALRYVFVFGTADYAAGIWHVHDALQAEGFRLQARRNSWDREENKCVTTMWLDPGHDLPFQVQFHTAASLEAQSLARTSASLISDPRIPPDQAENLRADLAATWSALPAPPGQGAIADYRTGGSAPRP